MKHFEKRNHQRTRQRIQIRFGNEQKFETGFITDVSNTGLAVLCRESPVTRIVTLQMNYENITANLACELRWKESVKLHGHNLTHVGLKVVSAPIEYLDIVKRVENQVPVFQDRNGRITPANPEDQDKFLEILPEDLNDDLS